MENGFQIQLPKNHFLQKLVDYYFFIDIPVSQLVMKEEYVLPFPRLTFGYFFEHPFSVTNHSKNKSQTAEMIISRISTDKISVAPLTDRVKILGAHVKPFTLAYLTNKNVSELPWIINTKELFGKKAESFQKKIDTCGSTKEMFTEVEKIFQNTVLAKDLSQIEIVMETIEATRGSVSISFLADTVGVTSRTLRNYFYKYIGCSPKDYLQLVKLKQSVFQMKNDPSSLTSLSYDQNFADQAYFSNTIKNLTDQSPKKIRENLPDFRFLQF
ncbi:helix-turn-helix domain-containing protein [Aequorivita marisscotiae]|uniref:AraC family transcriptional regulator n=1 Tax=Aequorivita marisscotiae TaxID=3040348 RepID=A0ABY8KQ36_9FLAO|nr:AraC family transcriptional regulator [Aequorivita sp. Ant34-E75]WGF91576.1 AraC family transcriptional regulator [Aequorivita sp. Ant34-E75]